MILELAPSWLADHARTAAGLMWLQAFVAPEPVPLTLLLTSGQATRPPRPEVASVIGPLLWDPIAVGDAITALRYRAGRCRAC